MSEKVVWVAARRRTLLFPAAGAVIWTAGSVMLMLFISILEGEMIVMADYLLIIAIGLLILNLLYGAIRGYWWCKRAGRTAIRIDDDVVTIIDRSGARIRYPRKDIFRCQVSGRYGWSSLLTAQPIDQFPRVRLVLRDGYVHIGPLLLWGNEVDRAATDLAEALHAP